MKSFDDSAQSTRRSMLGIRSRCRLRKLVLEQFETRRVLATITVDTLTDGELSALAGDGRISLREAIAAANQNRSIDGSPAGSSSVRDSIVFAPGLTGTIDLIHGGELFSTDSLLIDGPGANQLEIRAQDSRILSVQSATTLRGLGLSGGVSSQGGAILNIASLELDRVSIHNNVSTDRGGAIVSTGTLTITNSSIANNRAVNSGGGIHNIGTLTITNSTIAGNELREDQPLAIEVSTSIQNTGIDNRVSIQKSSQVFYTGANSQFFNLAPRDSAVTVETGTLGIVLGNYNAALFENPEPYQAPVSIDVVVTEIETGEEGVIIIDDRVIGTVNYDEDNKASGYSLDLQRSFNDNTVLVGSRRYSLIVADASLSAFGNAESAQKTIQAQLGVVRQGAGIFDAGTLTINNSTIVGNFSRGIGAGGIQGGPIVRLNNTIVAGNGTNASINPDIEVVGQRTSSFNLIGAVNSQTSPFFNGVSDNLVGIDWKTVVENNGTIPLIKNNGGTVPTVLPLRTGAAVDRGQPSFDATTLPNDQRGIGFARVTDGNSDGIARLDIGAIELPLLRYDFGDAPSAQQSGLSNSYPVTLAQNGARHLRTSLLLGAAFDDELDGSSSPQTDGDDTLGIDDEDGVRAITSLLSGSQTNIGGLEVTASATGKLDAWIDWNRDGDWQDLGERVLTAHALQAGPNLVGISVPAGLAAGNVFARFRLSSAGNLAVTGAADDGEVEDMMLSVLGSGTAAIISPTDAGPATLSSSTGDIVVTQNGVIIFQAQSNDSPEFRLVGSDAANTLRLAQGTSLPFNKIRADGGVGFDSLVIVDSGYTLNLASTGAVANLERIELNGSGPNALQLDLFGIQLLAPTLQLKHDSDDTVNFGNGWLVDQPVFQRGQFVHRLTQADSTIEIENTRPYRNPLRELDVNSDGQVAPIDALLIINAINNSTSSQLAAVTVATPLENWEYLDTNSDGQLSAIDALLVINRLNNPAASEGEAASGSPLEDIDSRRRKRIGY